MRKPTITVTTRINTSNDKKHCDPWHHPSGKCRFLVSDCFSFDYCLLFEKKITVRNNDYCRECIKAGKAHLTEGQCPPSKIKKEQ
jgi:hypothetical protein